MRRRLRPRLRFAAGALVALASCSTPTDTQPFPGMCAPLQTLTWEPRPFSQQAPRDAVVRITFDDYPDPDTVGPAAFLLTTGVFWHTGVYEVDLIDKSISFRAAGPLRPDLGYTITLMPSLLSLQGCATTLAHRSFKTGNLFTRPVAPPPVAFSDVQPILKRACGGAGCHRAAAEVDGGGCLDAPAGGLSLCDPDAVDALVGVPSRQVSRLQLVEPRNSARSYLLRKLLPASTGDGPAPTTLGHRDPPGAALPETDLRTIARWIDSGAPR